MVSTTTTSPSTLHTCHEQRSTGNMKGKKKALLAAALTIGSSNLLVSTTAFQATKLPSPSMERRSRLDYAVFGERTSSVASTIEIEKPQKPKKKKKSSNRTNQHGYIVANHDHERSFWLHALENLESSNESNEDSLWTTIARAHGPKALRERIPSETVPTRGGELVRVGDTDLDIALAFDKEEDVSSMLGKSVVSVINESRRQLVTIRVDFPEGSSFDKDAWSFEDELSAVIRQVRLLEETANDKLSKLQEKAKKP